MQGFIVSDKIYSMLDFLSQYHMLGVGFSFLNTQDLFCPSVCVIVIFVQQKCDAQDLPHLASEKSERPENPFLFLSLSSLFLSSHYLYLIMI